MTRLLIIDTETGGTNPFLHSILSLAGVVWEEGTVKGVFEILINEGSHLVVDTEAMEINRIDLKDVRERGVSPAAAVAAFKEFLWCHFEPDERKVSVAGHNVGFDVGFLKRLYTEAGEDYDAVFSHRLLDTASVIAFLSLTDKISLTGAGSTAAFEYFGILVHARDRHTASGDALATARLLSKLVDLVQGDSSFDHLRPLTPHAGK
jgi:DNA polymerase-3 subunit epsilon